MSTGREVAVVAEEEEFQPEVVACQVDQCRGDRRRVRLEQTTGTDAAEAMAGMRCVPIEWTGIAREGHRQDRRHMGTVTSGDNNTIHRKVRTNPSEGLEMRHG